MTITPKPVSRLFWVPILLVVSGTSIASATDDNIATLQAQGYEVVGKTRVAANEEDGFVFDGCENGEQIPFTNGQTFVCGDDIDVSIEFVPEVVILSNPKTQKTRVIIEGQIFDGTLQGATTLSPRSEESPAALPPPPTLSPPNPR